MEHPDKSINENKNFFLPQKKEIIKAPNLNSIDDPGFRRKMESGEFIRHEHKWDEVGPLRIFECKERGEIRIGNCRFYEPVILRCNPGGYIELGDFSHFGANVEIHSKTMVKIGRYCGIAPGCYIVDCSYHGMGDNPQKAAPVIIEDQAWLAPEVAVNLGVTIGRGAYVGMRSTVTKDVPPFTFVAGTPARIIKEIEPFEGKHGGEYEPKFWDSDFKPHPFKL